MLFDTINKQDKINIYSKDRDGVYLYINPSQASCFQVSNINDVIGMTDKALACQADHAATVIENDHCIIETEQMHTFFETGPYNGKSRYYRSYKFPLFGINGKVLGVHGLSIPVSKNCLVSLTNQQTACLKHLAKGYTHKQIARELGLS